MVGLGVMGSNLALNIAEKGYTVAVYDRDEPVLKAFLDKAGPLRDKIIPCATFEELAENTRKPRPFIFLIKAGTTPSPAQLTKIANFRRAWEDYFEKSCDGRLAVNELG